jgi:hypothetical protein
MCAVLYYSVQANWTIFSYDFEIIIIVTVTKSYSVYIKYYSKQGEKIVVLVRIQI